MNKVIAVFTSMGTLLLAGCVNVIVHCPCDQHDQHQQHAPVAVVRPGHPGMMPGTMSMPQNSRMVPTEPALPGSVEYKLREHGKTWVRTHGELEKGCYVEDILKGRLDQPKGRGDIGQVVSLSKNESGRPCATVDFGRGYKAGIDVAELSLLQISDGHKKRSRD